MKLVFATNNPHKLEEARRILDGRLEILSLADIGCHEDIPETSPTLEGNALQKARWIQSHYGVDCFADDTGLMVDALGGAPGVLSARYAGPVHDSQANMKKLLTEMEGATDRKAHFSTVVALLRDGAEHTFEGRVDGTIATSPQGEGGFGYDPIFIPDETGISFASMSMEAKNEISHRGRAMRKLADFLRRGLPILVAVILFALGNGQAAAESWRLFHSYNGWPARIAATAKNTYLLCEMQEYSPTSAAINTHHINIFRTDPDGGGMQPLGISSGLSSGMARAAEYNYREGYLCIAWPDGSLDLLDEAGKSRHLPGIAITDSELSHEIRGINFDPDSRDIYLATDFGYVVVDGEGGEISTSRKLDDRLEAAVPFEGQVFLIHGDELLHGAPSARSLADFSPLDIPGPKQLLRVGSHLYIRYQAPEGSRVARIVKEGSGFTFHNISGGPITAMEETPVGLLILEWERARLFDKSKDFAETSYPLIEADQQRMGSTPDGRKFWFCHGKRGFTLKQAPASGNDWKVLSGEQFPNASNVFISSAMLYTPDKGMLVQNHGITAEFVSTYHTTPDLLCGYRDMTWTPWSPYYNMGEYVYYHFLPDAVARDPRNSDHVYSGSAISGLFRNDLSDPAKSLHLSHTSDAGNKAPGFIEVIEDDPRYWGFAGLNRPSFDSYGNLWLTHHAQGPNMTGEKYYEIWAWTPEARLATKDKATFQPFIKFEMKGARSVRTVHLATFSHPSNKNIIAATGGSAVSGIHLLDFGGTVADRSDDKVVLVEELVDQDNQVLDYGAIRCWYEDPSTGLVWVGAKGVFTFEPPKMMAGEGVRRIKVSRDDGTNLADFLLDGVNVNMIAADASGDKWFATTGAGLVRTSSDGRRVKKSYTTANSPLPDNTIHAICYNPDQNSMMISTGAGLCELYLDGEGAEEGSVRAYPNPVRPGFGGYVVIDGLPDGAAVKIVDAGGNLVKALDEALAGESRWDLTDHQHKRVPGGVYFIVASSGADGGDFAKVGKIAVVN